MSGEAEYGKVTTIKHAVSGRMSNNHALYVREIIADHLPKLGREHPLPRGRGILQDMRPGIQVLQF